MYIGQICFFNIILTLEIIVFYRKQVYEKMKRLGIDIGSTTVKVAVIDEQHNILFSDYQRHFAKIQETLSSLLKKAKDQIGEMTFAPTVTGSGGLSISSYLDIPFCQEVVCVSSALQDYAPQTDVAIELGGEDAKIIYFTNVFPLGSGLWVSISRHTHILCFQMRPHIYISIFRLFVGSLQYAGYFVLDTPARQCSNKI